MDVAFSIDPAQGLNPADEIDCVRRAAELGYRSAWTPGRGDPDAFDRCLAWHQATGLPTGIAVVPASGQPPRFYAEHAARVWAGCRGQFVLGVGSGRMEHPAREMRRYLAELRELLPPELPIYLASLGPLMLQVAGELADGVSLNWCSALQVAWSRGEVERAAGRVGRKVPPIAEYIRTAVDPDPDTAAGVLRDALKGDVNDNDGYQKHFERMGLAGDGGANGMSLDSDTLSAVGAWGGPGEVRDQFLRLSRGLDCAIVRVLVARPGDAESAQLVLEECRPS